ncbi:MAG: response regulator [Proteobacteria bacterium]|nr:response regulator [Pseudomonadota bacterium]
MTNAKAKILVVDDEKTNIDVLVGLLADDYKVVVAKSGEEALKRAQTDAPPDLILLDVIMPNMSGFDVCRRLKANESTRGIPVIFVTSKGEEGDEAEGFSLGAVDYVNKPFSPAILSARIRIHLAMVNQKHHLEQEVKDRTSELLQTQEALREAMGNLLTIKVAPGVFWLQIPEADLRILCGCPGEVVKLLMRKGLNNPAVKNGVNFETGPNVILLSDLLVQNGGFSNLAEFPVLQMLYRQGMMLPGHPNNTGIKPMLIGSSQQVRAQLEYIHRGNYGLLSREEILAAGIDKPAADMIMRIKLKFAFGQIREPSEFLDTLDIDGTPREIRNGAFVRRVGFNVFHFIYRGKSAEIDLNLPKDEVYQSPYPLVYHRVQQHYFAVLHTGEGDGWNTEHRSMGSVLMFQGRIYLIDASPGVINSLNALGIDISEVDGVFHTHSHDDHFGGLPDLIRTDRRLKYFATPLVRYAVTKKLAALMSLDEGKFEQFFDIQDLEFDTWNKFGGLEVMPVFSPHPVENNMFLFRALDWNGYRTYAHWADLSSFEVLDKMVGDGPGDIPLEYIQAVKNRYHHPADLKKLDVGGGLIHGATRDFVDDPSGRLLLAHLSRKVTAEEMEIGSETSFGAIDILIPGEQDHRRQKAFHYLQELFPETSNDEIRMLINGPIVEHNAGSIIRRVGDDIGFVEMIISGNVLYLNTDSGIRNHLGFGSFMGLRRMFRDDISDQGTYRAASHGAALRIHLPLFKAFLENNGLFEKLATRLENIHFLLNTWLFGEQISFVFLDRLSQAMDEISVSDGAIVDLKADPCLWLVRAGRVLMTDESGELLDVLAPGGFFGEHCYLAEGDRELKFQADGDCRLFRLPWQGLLDAPIIHWKMLEISEKRSRLSGASSKTDCTLHS